MPFLKELAPGIDPASAWRDGFPPEVTRQTGPGQGAGVRRLYGKPLPDFCL